MHEVPETDPLTERVLSARAGLTALISEADRARQRRAEAASAPDGGQAGRDGERSDSGAVCAWNHFENIPTFYNWNNRPR
ncbi:MAG: hypothetical protein IRZ05_13725 [Micromonosporaceae bacterium]|nr:hypothetical protein [Micromonosporaceae bacterium]